MRNAVRLSTLALLVCSGAFAQSTEATFDVVTRAKKCATNSFSGSIDCEYKEAGTCTSPLPASVRRMES